VFIVFCYRSSPETFGYTFVCFVRSPDYELHSSMSEQKLDVRVSKIANFSSYLMSSTEGRSGTHGRRKKGYSYLKHYLIHWLFQWLHYLRCLVLEGNSDTGIMGLILDEVWLCVCFSVPCPVSGRGLVIGQSLVHGSYQMSKRIHSFRSSF
jgi:hypothetical protein